jgi:ornithine decarboxylase
MREDAVVGVLLDEHRQLKEFIDTTSVKTPYLVLDTGIAAARYRRLTDAFARARVFYAVKANPEPALVRTLARCGSSFDVASVAEVDLCLAEGVDPNDLSYGNPVKKVEHIAYAYQRGVRTFVLDSESELHKLAEHAPGASVFCRVLASSAGAQWPLSNKFGCSQDMAVELLVEAKSRGLHPIGVSFHVGSQQLDPFRWAPSVACAAEVFDAVGRCGIELTTLNIGGGFPAAYTELILPIEAYAEAIEFAVLRHFGGSVPELVIEPGRYIAAEAGILRAQVVLVSRKNHDDDVRWIYLDVGRFGGLAETEGEAIRYQLDTGRDGPVGPVIIAGPTCDSIDVLYQKSDYRLPRDLRAGDHLNIMTAGAYTATYSSVGFNGFPALNTICIGEGS